MAIPTLLSFMHPAGFCVFSDRSDDDGDRLEHELRQAAHLHTMSASQHILGAPSSPVSEAHNGYLSDLLGRFHGRNPEAESGPDNNNTTPAHTNPARNTSTAESSENENTLPVETFVRSQSRVLRLHRPWLSATNAYHAQYVKDLQPTVWHVREGHVDPHISSPLWVVFRTHEEACTALCISNPTLILTPATEQELEATHNLHQVTWIELEDMSNFAVYAEPTRPSASSHSPHWNVSNDLFSQAIPGSGNVTRELVLNTNVHELYNISSNPPNPKLSFRAGDWWCPLAHCAAHNFGRNVGCIKCGTPRAIHGAQSGGSISPIQSSQPPQISPRFINQLNPLDDIAHMLESRIPHHQVLRTQVPNKASHGFNPSLPSINVGSKAPLPQYPILTPSGAALSAGGRVRNVSSDPLAPCIMYWPDNEPVPEPGQVRPFGSAVLQFPPIINTGNKGAAEQQPGDWICQKCKYLNWRRRKVCQTCFPYAEGNGDSISAAVQAERIALLAGVLNKAEPSHLTQHQLPMPPSGYVWDPPRAWPESDASPYRVIPRQDTLPKFQHIYQTPDNVPYTPSPRMGYAPPVPNSCNFLPSFLQDIVQSPALSPATSTSSSDTGLEDSFANFEITEGFASSRIRRHPYSTSSSSSVSSASIASIWKLDGEESKTMGLGNVSPVEKVTTAFQSYA